MVSRGLTANMQAAIAAGQLKPVRLLEMHFDGGTLYHTTCYKSLAWNSNTYNPGNVVAMPNVEESLELRVPVYKVTLSGVNQANIATALLEDSIDRLVVMYRGLLDANENLIADPFEEFKGRIDTYAMDEDPDKGASTLAWSCVSHLADFERLAGRRTNDDDQQVYFAGDRGFEFSALVAQDIKWGRA